MKKLICMTLCLLLVVASLSFAACGETEAETLQFGFGVYTATPSATDAGEKDGQGKVTSTVAVVSVDKDGKIVACALDTADFTVKYTAEGKVVATDSFKTKYELGNDYNMKAYGGATLEWFEQADAFETLVCGKTLDEVKALVAESGYGTDAVTAAGCTIGVTDFVNAIEKAYNNKADSNVTAEDTLKVGVYAEQSGNDATEEKAGSVKLATSYFAAAVDAEGKVVATGIDCVEVTFGFTTAGASTFDATAPVLSKYEKGEGYNMKAYGGAALEWFEQADAFEALCAGKTIAEITALMASDNYGTDEVKTAGCTILVNGFVKAAAKLG